MYVGHVYIGDAILEYISLTHGVSLHFHINHY